MPSVNTALLMIDNANENLQPASLLSVAGKAIIHRQISQLRKLGVTRFIIAIASMNSHILEFTNDIRKTGIEVEYVRSLHALGDILSDTDQFLLMSEAILCEDSYIEALCRSKKAQILALANVSKYDQFELIDLEHRWAGLAKIDGSLISSLEIMPEDSDIHSTLLRLALQNKCNLNIIKPSAYDIFKIGGLEQAEHLSNIYLKTLGDIIKNKAVVETFIFTPATMAILPKLWNNRSAREALQFIPSAIGSVSLLFLLLQWYVIAFTLALIMCFSSSLLQKYNYFNETKIPAIFNIIEPILLLLLLLLSVTSSPPIYYIVSTILFLLCYSIQHLNFDKRLHIFRVSFPDIFLILLLTSVWNVQSYAILTMALLLSIWIFIGIVLAQNNHRFDC